MHELRHAAAAAVLHSVYDDPDIRILRRVSSLDDFPLAPRGAGPFRKVAITDVETTGTDPMLDEVIDVAVVVVEINGAGEIIALVAAGAALRDPGMSIPTAITKLTGITDEDVQGKAIDLDRLEARLASADVRIAHNASFDIAFLENLMPHLAGREWACSANEIDWLNAGMDGRKLGHLLMQIGRFNTGHRAMADVISLLHLLAHRLPDDRTAMAALLETAEQHTVRLEANGAPFDKREPLKARGYRWDPRARVWWCQVAEADQSEEERWLREHINPYGPPPRATPITWRERHR